MKPVDSGLHTVTITVNDSINEVSENIMVDVSAKSDLLIESVSIKRNGAEISNAEDGDVVEITSYIRNQGRGTANGIDVRCYVNDVLIDIKKIDILQPGAIISAVCDTSLLGNDQDNIIKIIVDSTLSIDESNEDNNQEEVTIFVSSPEIRSSGGTGESFKETTIIVLGLLIVLISFVLLQLSPGKIRKPYNKRK
tara:strand:- start:9 stop:593 length:585 start_codon:yes stop_codon:yes gene_type:complete